MKRRLSDADTFRAMCADMLEAFDGLPCETNYRGQSRLIVCIDEEPFDRARALLAQPVAEEPTVMEILELHSWLEDEWRANNDGEDLPTLDFARALLAKWGHPTLQPVAVSERLPGAKDCIKRGNDHWNDDWCWGQERSLLTGQASAKWRLMRVSALTDEAVNWLPANALPIPTPGHFCNQLAHPQPPADGEVRE
jgi:hypothetical protein